MYIDRIEITKARTSGIMTSAKTKFNKLTIMMGAVLSEEEGSDVHKRINCRKELSETIDQALIDETEESSEQITI